MKLSILFLLTSLLIGVPRPLLARDVHVKGYYRKDGTFTFGLISGLRLRALGQTITAHREATMN